MPRSETLEGPRRPTALSSCAWATTAEEARFRLSYPRASQVSRVLALDDGAEGIVCCLATREWTGDARFLIVHELTAAQGESTPVDASLRDCEGTTTTLLAELDVAEIVVMVATSDEAAAAAELIGDACAERQIMTTGLVLAAWGELDAAVSSLRPNAMVMVLSSDEEELVGLLAALRV